MTDRDKNRALGQVVDRLYGHVLADGDSARFATAVLLDAGLAKRAGALSEIELTELGTHALDLLALSKLPKARKPLASAGQTAARALDAVQDAKLHTKLAEPRETQP